MERLTQRNQFGEVEITNKDENDFHDKAIKTANRLAELEYKIESGKFIDVEPCIYQNNSGQWYIREIILTYRHTRCATEAQAKARLKELQESKNDERH